MEVAVKSLIKTYGEAQEGISSQQTELGASLTCHLLLMLFQTVEGTYPNINQQQNSLNGSGIKHRYVSHCVLFFFYFFVSCNFLFICLFNVYIIVVISSF